MSEPAKDLARDPEKKAVSPTIVKKGAKPEDDGDEAIAPAPAPKQKMLPTGLSRAIVLATILGVLVMGTVTLFTNRYEILAVPNSANGAIYRLDRLTGSLKFCGATACSSINVDAEAK